MKQFSSELVLWINPALIRRNAAVSSFSKACRTGLVRNVGNLEEDAPKATHFVGLMALSRICIPGKDVSRKRIRFHEYAGQRQS